MAIRCACPPDSARGRADKIPSFNPTSSINETTFPFRRGFPQSGCRLDTARSNCTSTDKAGLRLAAGSWGITCIESRLSISRSSRARGNSSRFSPMRSSIFPESATREPTSAETIVLFPAPEGPRIASPSPAWSSNETADAAVLPSGVVTVKSDTRKRGREASSWFALSQDESACALINSWV